MQEELHMQRRQLNLLVWLSACVAPEFYSLRNLYGTCWIVDQGISVTAPSNLCTLQIKPSSQRIFESQLSFTLSIFEAMKDWIRRNHPLYLIYKFKEFKVMYISSHDIYIWPNLALVNHFLPWFSFTLTTGSDILNNRTRHKGRQVYTSCNFNISLFSYN